MNICLNNTEIGVTTPFTSPLSLTRPGAVRSAILDLHHHAPTSIGSKALRLWPQHGESGSAPSNYVKEKFKQKLHTKQVSFPCTIQRRRNYRASSVIVLHRVLVKTPSSSHKVTLHTPGQHTSRRLEGRQAPGAGAQVLSSTYTKRL